MQKPADPPPTKEEAPAEEEAPEEAPAEAPAEKSVTIEEELPTRKRKGKAKKQLTPEEQREREDRLRRRINKLMQSPPNFERLVLGCIENLKPNFASKYSSESS